MPIFTVVLSVALIVTLSTPPAAGEEHTSSPSVACWRQTGEAKTRCYQQRLDYILQTQGTEQALTALERFAAQDPEVLRDAHPYAHHLGRAAFAHYQDVAVAFSRCRDVFWSGCYHGVLEGYLRSLPGVEPHHVAGLCGAQIKTEQSRFLQYQCVHGLGHGLMMYLHHDVPSALALCDALPAAWDQQACYGGVFMENIVAFQNPHHGHGHTRWLNPQDPLYPCTAVDRRYQHACYSMQSSAILTFTNQDFVQAFRECGKAPVEFASVCYQSLGRDISGFALRDAEKVVELCEQGPEDAVRHCFVGAAKDFILSSADPQRGLALCRRLSAPLKMDCYGAVGQVVAILYPEQERRKEVCTGAEEAYVGPCLVAAQAL
ncbi:MAG: hypothetical protein AB1671_06320 [Thermodesulfobacteriota bacterium]|jgi:hypothetical protein